MLDHGNAGNGRGTQIHYYYHIRSSKEIPTNLQLLISIFYHFISIKKNKTDSKLTVTTCHKPHQHQPTLSNNWTKHHNIHNLVATSTLAMPLTTMMVHTMNVTTTQASMAAHRTSCVQLPLLQPQLSHNSTKPNQLRCNHRTSLLTTKNNITTNNKLNDSQRQHHTVSSHQANCNWAGLPTVSATPSTKFKLANDLHLTTATTTTTINKNK